MRLQSGSLSDEGATHDAEEKSSSDALTPWLQLLNGPDDEADVAEFRCSGAAFRPPCHNGRLKGVGNVPKKRLCNVTIQMFATGGRKIRSCLKLKAEVATVGVVASTT